MSRFSAPEYNEEFFVFDIESFEVEKGFIASLFSSDTEIRKEPVKVPETEINEYIGELYESIKNDVSYRFSDKSMKTDEEGHLKDFTIRSSNREITCCVLHGKGAVSSEFLEELGIEVYRPVRANRIKLKSEYKPSRADNKERLTGAGQKINDYFDDLAEKDEFHSAAGDDGWIFYNTSCKGLRDPEDPEIVESQ